MNPLFQSFQRQQQSSAMPGNMQPPSNLQDLMHMATQRLVMPGMNEEQTVRWLIDKGAITQEQFEWAARIADQWMPRR